MSDKAVKELRALAKFYDKHADTFPEGSLGRISNRAESDKYRDIAVRASGWPEEHDAGHIVDPRFE